jgi:hypothetical protein
LEEDWELLGSGLTTLANKCVLEKKADDLKKLGDKVSILPKHYALFLPHVIVLGHWNRLTYNRY